MKLTHKQISESIIKMADQDQKARSEENLDWDKIDAIDKKNNIEIKKIVNEHGLIGKRDYGDEASYKAWLLIQHMPEDDLQFMKKYLSLMKSNLEDIDKKNYAYLSDRINMYEDTPQVYGTQTVSESDSSDMKFHTIENIRTVDKKREEVGLDSLKDYAESMGKMFNQKILLPSGYKPLK